jgi:hypothetical protein
MFNENTIENYINKNNTYFKQIFSGDTHICQLINMNNVLIKYIDLYQIQNLNIKGIYFDFNKIINISKYRISKDKIIINFENIINFNTDLFTNIKIYCKNKSNFDYDFILYDNRGINEIKIYKNNIPLLYTQNYILKLEIYNLDINIDEINITGIIYELVPEERKNFLNISDKKEYQEILLNSTWF